MRIKNQSDDTILIELGQRLTQARLDRNLTQEGLAAAAAVSKRTVERLEDGGSVQASNLVRVLRALDLSGNLEQLIPPAGPRPIEQLKHRSKRRRRASAPKPKPAAPWTWGDKT